MKNPRISNAPTGQPALYCDRGLVCIFEAGSQMTREQDAREVLAAIKERDRLREVLADAEFLARKISNNWIEASAMQDSFARLAEDCREILRKKS
jgi:hypothetical protein